ncbi:30S ribosomal protein S5 [Candidatus Saganbacteria bacterium CG08_land_8_20_14_0_20_45_16]|uniref:Small ribosomal subunit protein uS5 n=1 Tax=Candidatus Saganbacteria bacterium CG08_land_8_20_14_0_20_45_16 TaxID=2014293 RepID=A0A2H0XZS5_UNCSA|nr:MAG: 30S ribosomal protein S5 [Candidatus Saganbacteria bacterium CG08_land_8_20_14_0_20_45_16]
MNVDKDKNSELKEKVVQIRRVTKVVKGGKKMGFRAVVVVGTEKAEVGLGIGKAAEVASAIRKGVEAGKKNMIKVVLVAGTLPHQIIGSFGASQVILRPAPQGTGVIAGGAVRTVLELAGVKNVVAKSLGSNNAINVARATLAALSMLKNLEVEQRLRGKELKVSYVTVE